MDRQQGFTLIELMVMINSELLLTILVKIFHDLTHSKSLPS
ncbi:prepilin-type N-terminal cleavage/methylation domain-containing protein [Enterobacter kobei]|nr:prepilin-type N-terminal cleavage/methylation domain-containing protein [Enterobacter kobei]RAY66946.1 hypothetical protein DP199_21345 [Enterobacter kobei]HBM0952748.1 prepilin-type N-terminal cleavage/methylation domain-containing protein [Enterobacter kobei]HBM0982436.1 prepilin-type N-terminal cleavage/methylation domain-containing protein [Enterobacter kobei]HCI5455941.1 prepilin-type N-terminal cleavage/methylation domain-containing protein [Enterobacter kobei]